MVNTFNDLFEEIKTAAFNAVQSLKGKLVQFEHAAVPVIEQDLLILLNQFKGLAVNLVTTLAQAEFENLTGTQKNTITVQTILASVKSSGKDIAVQDAQLLAQQAFNAVKFAVK